MIRVLFVCTGNICRSPTAEGVFRALVESAGLERRIETDSAGTIGYHAGSPPDGRSQETALERGIDLSGQRARQIEASDFSGYDYLVALDSSHRDRLTELCPDGEDHRICMLMDFAPQAGVRDVPDPYFSVFGGFERVFDLIEAGARGLLEDIRKRTP